MKTITTLNTALTTLSAAIIEAVITDGKFAFEGKATVSLPMQRVLLESAMGEIKEPTMLTKVGGKTPYYMLSLASFIQGKAEKSKGKKEAEGKSTDEEESNDKPEAKEEVEFSLEDALKELDIEQLQEVAASLKIEVGRKKEAGIIKLLMEEANKGKRQHDKVVRRLPVEEATTEEDSTETPNDEPLSEDELRSNALELGMKKKVAKKASREDLEAYIAENTEEESTEVSDEDPIGGFVYIVFEDEDDATNTVEKLTQTLVKNGYKEDDINNVLGHNGEDDEESFSHVYIDDEEFDNSLAAAFKKVAKKLEDDDYAVYTEDKYNAKFIEESTDEETEDESGELAPVTFINAIGELKANKGKAKGRKAQIEVMLAATWDKPKAGDWKALEELADTTSDDDGITDIIEALQEALEGAQLKAFNKAFKEWF